MEKLAFTDDFTIFCYLASDAMRISLIINLTYQQPIIFVLCPFILEIDVWQLQL